MLPCRNLRCCFDFVRMTQTLPRIPFRIPKAYGLLALVYMLLLAWASPNLRGSDQYWYVSDVERVVLGDGQFKTNSVFPNSLPEDLTQLPRPWVQNKPATYAVLPLVYLTRNGHWAWLVFNALCLFGSAWLIARTLRLGERASFWFTAFFVFFPFNFYLASQALPEIFVMVLIAAILYGLLRLRVTWKNALLLGFLTGLLYWQRSNYVLLLAVVPLVFGLREKRKALVPALVFIGAAEVLFQIAPRLFNEHLPKMPRMLDIVLRNKQEQSNMSAFFETYDHSNVTAGELLAVGWEKLQGAVVTQFEMGALSSIVMFYTINVMFLGLIGLMFSKKTGVQTKVALLGIAGIHLATIVLFYNQYRYAASVIPVLFVACVLCVRGFEFWRRPMWIYASVAGVLAFSVVMGHSLRMDAQTESRMVAALQERDASSVKTPIMCAYNGGGCLSVGYAVSPETVFYYPPDFTAEQYLDTARKLGASRGVLYAKNALYKQLEPRMRSISRSNGFIFFEFDNHE